MRLGRGTRYAHRGRSGGSDPAGGPSRSPRRAMVECVSTLGWRSASTALAGPPDPLLARSRRRAGAVPPGGSRGHLRPRWRPAPAPGLDLRAPPGTHGPAGCPCSRRGTGGAGCRRGAARSAGGGRHRQHLPQRDRSSCRCRSSTRRRRRAPTSSTADLLHRHPTPVPVPLRRRRLAPRPACGPCRPGAGGAGGVGAGCGAGRRPLGVTAAAARLRRRCGTTVRGQRARP